MHVFDIMLSAAPSMNSLAQHNKTASLYCWKTSFAFFITSETITAETTQLAENQPEAFILGYAYMQYTVSSKQKWDTKNRREQCIILLKIKTVKKFQ